MFLASINPLICVVRVFLAETKGPDQREDEGVAGAHPSCQQGRIESNS